MGIRSRVAVLAISQLIATPFAFGSVIFEPMWAMINLGISYFFAEMWFGIVFAILVEVVPLRLRSTTVGIFLFVMNNIGGNLPILVDPVAKAYNYRVAINIFYAGFYLLSKYLVTFMSVLPVRMGFEYRILKSFHSVSVFGLMFFFGFGSKQTYGILVSVQNNGIRINFEKTVVFLFDFGIQNGIRTN